MQTEATTDQRQMQWDDAKAVGILPEEWDHLLSQLGRTPTHEELHMIGVMWSEHCSYKSSKRFLKNLITQSEAVLQGPGENAGLVRLDEKRAIAFKVESHNHPSYVEPFQGAATGVGGILRDIFTMGARPLALANYLRFGELKTPKQQFLLGGVVGGISHYGNCIGVPTLAGQVHTDACYDKNILVNVFALGIVDQDRIYKSNTAKPGCSVMLWGAKTGRDGIHGASLLASADFNESSGESAEQKIRVQVGDPFKEKCLMEACLDAMENLSEELVAIQDMGAAGLTCSTMEIAEKSQIGILIDLDKVPVREQGMEAYELLLSESQERMLAVVEKGSEEKFQKLLHRWGCECEVVGETTPGNQLKMTYKGEPVVDLPVSKMTEPCEVKLPRPELQTQRSLFDSKDSSSESSSGSRPEDVKEEWQVLKYILSLPRIASKKNIYEKYDSTVGAATVFGPGAEAALLWVGSKENPLQGISFKGAWDESFAKINSNYAAKYAMAECYRSLLCMGSKPLGITDGINLGNPNNPKVLGALQESIDGMNEAIREFNTPCIGGNVSLYNQTQTSDGPRDIHPTIFIVMAGSVENVELAVPNVFQEPDSEIWLLEVPGNRQELPYGSLYARVFWQESSEATKLPFLDLSGEKKLGSLMMEALQGRMLRSCRSVKDGGLAVALAQSCISSQKPLGFDGEWSKYQSRRDFSLFNESAGRIVIEVSPKKRAEIMALGRKHQIDVKRIGQLNESAKFRIRPLMTGMVEELQEAWTSTL